MKKLFFTTLLMSYIGIASAQLEISSFNATGGAYTTTWLNGYQSLGVNPANLGWVHEKYSMTLGVNELALSVYAEPLTRSQVIKDLWDDKIKFANEQKKQTAKDFTDKRLWAQAGYTLLGFSFNSEKAGGFAFSARNRALWSSRLNSNACNFIFMGYRDPYFTNHKIDTLTGDTLYGYNPNYGYSDSVYGDSYGHMLWYNEINFGYGRHIYKNKDFQIYAGVGVKYLMGYGSLMYKYNNTDLSYSALNPVFDVQYDNTTDPMDTSKMLKSNGNGFALDFGLTVAYKKFTAAVSLIDMGHIKWNCNVYNGVRSSVWKIESIGINNYNIFSEGQLLNADNAPGTSEEWVGIRSKTVPLPMHLRAGASYKIWENLEGGFDSYIPIKTSVPGSFANPVFAIGGRYKPIKWFMVSMGAVTGGQFSTMVPVGLSFFPSNNEHLRWEVGVAMRDVSSFMKQKDPVVSLAFGFLRFEFGEIKVPVEDPNKSKF